MAPPSGVPGSKIYDFLRSRVSPSGVPGSKIYDFWRSGVSPRRSGAQNHPETYFFTDFLMVLVVLGSKIYDFVRSRVSPSGVPGSMVVS